MYQRILVPLDGSATALRALHEATRLAVEQRAELILLHIVAGFPTVGEIASPYSLEDLAASHRKSAEALLDRVAVIPKAAEVPTRISVLIPTTSIEEAIVDEAVHSACDLIIVGTHGRSGLPRMLLGSVAEGVARRSSVPVMLVPAMPMEDD